MDKSSIKIFILEPLAEHQDNGKIVYADNAKQARIAASALQDGEFDAISNDVYLDEGMSTCIEAEPTITNMSHDGSIVKINYHDVIYDLTKDVAQKVISQSMI